MPRQLLAARRIVQGMVEDDDVNRRAVPSQLNLEASAWHMEEGDGVKVGGVPRQLEAPRATAWRTVEAIGVKRRAVSTQP